MLQYFNIFLLIMIIIAVIVFIALYFVTAGYGVFYNKKWGPTVPNKLGWIMMESPVFVVMILLCVFSERSSNIVCLIFLILFEIHYFQRSFVFPFLIRGKSKMPLSVIVMGVVFNVLNAIMQGGWIFYVSPENMYELSWLLSPQFIIGTLIFFAGMLINIHSDYVIRNLRKPGDTRHYLPKKGIFKYVTSANYFGEFVEWLGFAILTWSLSGAVFAVWTFANLTPRAAKIYDNYKREFGDELDTKKVKRIIPFIY